MQGFHGGPDKGGEAGPYVFGIVCESGLVGDFREHGDAAFPAHAGEGFGVVAQQPAFVPDIRIGAGTRIAYRFRDRTVEDHPAHAQAVRLQHVERKQGVVDAAELVPHDEQDRKIDLPHEVEHGFAVIHHPKAGCSQ